MIALIPGDFFCVTAPDDNDNIIHHGIRWFSKIRSKDNHAIYTHAGIVISPSGRTFEALSKGYSKGNLWADYSGCPILIGRHVDMTMERFASAWERIRLLEGFPYPYFRFPFQTSTVWAKLLPMRADGRFFIGPDCSEMACMFGRYANLRDMHYCKGTTPDDLADSIKRYDVFEILYEGEA